MKFDCLKYGKDDGNREWMELEKRDSHAVSRLQAIKLTPSLPSGYTKTEGTIDVRIIFILSGGEVREKNYFKMLMDDQQIERVKIAFASKKGQGLNPTQLLKEANNCISSGLFTTEEGSFHFEEDKGDILYILQDIDEFEKEIAVLQQLKQPNCLHWIYSNPAFEIWLFYHYYDNPLPLLEDAIDKTPAERSLWLKNFLPKIIKGGVNTTKAIREIRKAIINSKANFQESDKLPMLFSTHMYSLAEDILYTMGSEYDLMITRKAAFNKAMMEKYRKPILKDVKYDGVKIQKLIRDMTAWVEVHQQILPHADDNAVYPHLHTENRIFPQSFKFEKAYLDDSLDGQMPVDTDELFLLNIQRDIYHFYNLQFLLNKPVMVYTIDFSEIKDVIDTLYLDSRYVLISSFHLDNFDSLHAGDPLESTDFGYIYHDVPIYCIPSSDRFIYIMQKDYLPRADFKEYEGNNLEYEAIDSFNMIYSNIHRMKDLGDYFGLSVMRAVRFLLPHKGSLRYVKLNIIDYSKEKSEFSKLSEECIVRLDFQEGDFVMYNGEIFEIQSITNHGGIAFKNLDTQVYMRDVSPVIINGKNDSEIYYDPLIVASFVRSGEEIPTFQVNLQYYMDTFRKEFLEEGTTLFDRVSELNFKYVHELQHWMSSTLGQCGLKLRRLY